MNCANLVGQKFHRLTVIERIERPKYYADSAAWWKCKCDCGNYTQATTTLLRTGYVKSCGCLRREVHSAPRRQKGVKVGKLTLEEKVLDARRHSMWVCRCDCGQEMLIYSREINKHSGGCPLCSKA